MQDLKAQLQEEKERAAQLEERVNNMGIQLQNAQTEIRNEVGQLYASISTSELCWLGGVGVENAARRAEARR